MPGARLGFATAGTLVGLAISAVFIAQAIGEIEARIADRIADRIAARSRAEKRPIAPCSTNANCPRTRACRCGRAREFAGSASDPKGI